MQDIAIWQVVCHKSKEVFLEKLARSLVCWLSLTYVVEAALQIAA